MYINKHTMKLKSLASNFVNIYFLTGYYGLISM